VYAVSASGDRVIEYEACRTEWSVMVRPVEHTGGGRSRYQHYWLDRIYADTPGAPVDKFIARHPPGGRRPAREGARRGAASRWAEALRATLKP
jgi:hypothetical protein